MDFPQLLQSFLASIVAFVIGILPELHRPQPQPQPQPATSSIDMESSQPQRLPSNSSPSPSNDHQHQQQRLQQESILTAQHHLQWQNAAIGFCFSYALALSLQFVGTDQSNHQHLPFPLALLSFLVLLTFTFILLAFFIRRKCTRISQAVERVAFLVAAAAFCHSLSIPFSFQLKCAVWAVYLISLLIVVIFALLHT